MDRNKALQQLEVVRFNADDLGDPDLSDAISALDADPAARQEFDRRLQLDAKIAAAMQQVEPTQGPADFKAKLLASAQTASTRKRTRRRLLMAALSLAAAAAVVFALLPADPTVGYQEIIASAPCDYDAVAGEATASSGDAVAAPSMELTPLHKRLLAARPAIAWPSKLHPFHDSTTPTSAVHAGQTGRIKWVLVVTPRDQVTDTPDFKAAGTNAGIRPGVTAGGWQDEKYVYVLFVNGRQRQFETVRDSLQGRAAV